MAFGASVFSRRPGSAVSKLLARVGVATALRDVGVGAVHAPGNLWQGTHTGEIERGAGGRT
jgi:hypothetical protein